MTTTIKKTFFYLILIQGGNYLFPLLLLPYLGKVLGVKEFGVLAYCQAIMQYLMLLTDYGYNLTATRLVSLHRNEPDALNRVYSSTTSGRVALMLGALLLLLGGIAFVPDIRQHWAVFAAASVGLIANALTPLWLFQGLERMKALVLPTFASKAISLICVVSLVKGDGDAALAALGISIGNAALAVAALAIISNGKLVAFTTVRLREIRVTLVDGFPVFLSVVLISFYVNFNSILLNYFYGPVVVGQFAMADKIRLAAQAVFVVIGQAFYPRISQYNANDPAAAHRLVRTAAVAIMGSSVVMLAVIMLAADWAVTFWLGEQFRPSIGLLKLEAIMLPVIGLALVYGNLGLMAMGKTHALRNVYVVATVLHMIYVVPLTLGWAAEGTIVSVILTELIGAAAFAWIYVRERRRLDTQAPPA
ncbi:polysaccharide transporter, PST family [Ralstonia sp. 25mfcol4.1]|uniref:oligosaccharide flippase family protein n=1 Tax=Ralstonia sp. 25mfcol4.1 TaxID=1761899 RepID=UPI000414B2F9|nr:oligosaccharide flippase family protein [Ralstonia sp. 25mfcol4.1]SDP57112.1 polysaccharide transporter, PST family [Ralstonia sp. 25mfcol4.1]